MIVFGRYPAVPCSPHSCWVAGQGCHSFFAVSQPSAARSASAFAQQSLSLYFVNMNWKPAENESPFLACIQQLMKNVTTPRFFTYAFGRLCMSDKKGSGFLALGYGLEPCGRHSASALAWAIALAHMPVPLNLSLHPSSLAIPPCASCKGLWYLLPTFPSKTSCPVLETSKSTGRASSLLCFQLR